MVKQVLRIFNKDVRHLWPIISVVLLLMVVHAVFDVRSLPINVSDTNGASSTLALLNILLPLGIFFLAAQVVFQETLPGNRQFWLPRPYRWTNLLASKVLFVLVFISVPLFLSDCYILAIQGFPVLGAFTDLLLRQLIVFVVFVLPSFALATLTTGIAQFLLAWFILLLVLISEQMLASITSHSYGRVTVNLGGGPVFVVSIAALFLTVIFWQYVTRRTTAARLALLVVICAPLPIVWGASFWPHHYSYRGAIEPQPPLTESDIDIALDLGRSVPPQANGQNTPLGMVRVQIPLSVAHLPPRTLLRGNSRITIIGTAGKPLPEPGYIWGGQVERIANEYWLTMSFDRLSFNTIQQQLVDLHTIFELQVVNDVTETTIPLTRTSYLVPNVGLCHVISDARQSFFTCRAGLTHPIQVDLRSNSSRVPGQVIAVLPEAIIPWGLSPTNDLGSPTLLDVQPGSTLEFVPRRKLADLYRTRDWQNIQLTKYIVSR